MKAIAMSKKLFGSLFVGFMLTAVTCAQTVQQQAPQPKPQQQPPPAGQPPKPPAQPYKPDFEIPKTDIAGTPQQQPSSQTQLPPEHYIIGPQDLLSIFVVDDADLTNKFRVDGDGTITLPYLNRVQIAGMTVGAAQTKLAQMLQAGFIKNPQVRIEIGEYKSRSVLVNGAVRNSGQIPMSSTTMSLLEALTRAGSPTASAANEVIVVHQDKPNEPVRVNRRDLELGQAGRDITLLDGDIINVPEAKRFYISGMVRNPGSLVLDTGTTVAQAIILAGGLLDRGSDRRISITREINGKTVEIKDVKPEDKVQPGDQINIKSRFF